MRLPTPDDPAESPVWENYIIAQTVESSRGQIPLHALAMGVEVDGRRIVLRFQLSELDESDLLDISEIVSEMSALVGDEVEIADIKEVLDQRSTSPDDGICWIFFSRV
ncbi:hypothetical protein [Kribbella sp. CA-293567]|uniref:hypothetical protein n=1 Tax=Kribbella sp. CA-293567 TaxID=3002436 RepID=UPI0022DD6228|nr:hypothetical protein [Kribbella sp. CA-293567]WBQ07745.1 hypothetical protein OX958_13305 [Kribbella sp. CA-293567]